MNSSANGGDMEVEDEEEDEFPSDPIQVLKLSAKTLEGSAFGARLPSHQMTAQEASCFQDIKQAGFEVHKRFIYIRNRIIQVSCFN